MRYYRFTRTNVIVTKTHQSYPLYTVFILVLRELYKEQIERRILLSLKPTIFILLKFHKLISFFFGVDFYYSYTFKTNFYVF